MIVKAFDKLLESFPLFVKLLLQSLTAKFKLMWSTGIRLYYVIILPSVLLRAFLDYHCTVKCQTYSQDFIAKKTY